MRRAFFPGGTRFSDGDEAEDQICKPLILRRLSLVPESASVEESGNVDVPGCELHEF